jgi:hypothetical protein
VLISRPDPLRAQAWLTSEAVGVGIRDAEKLLQITGGSPLTAATWAEQGWIDAYQSSIDVLTHPDEGPLAMAGRWESQLRASPERSLESLVAQIQKWLVDLIQVKLIGKPRFHLAWSENLQVLAEPSSLGRLFNCYNELMEIRAVAGHPLNTLLFLEDLATRYLRALKPEKT